jgi:hypothetical protein
MRRLTSQIGAPTHSLGYWSRRSAEGPVHMHGCRDITKTEFDTYLAAIAKFRALTERTTFTLLQRNKHALEATLAACSNVERVGGSFRRLDTRALSVTLMGELLNWLVAGTLYDKSTENLLRTHLIDAAEAVRRFQEARRRASMRFTGYRFMRELRHYAQHAGPPLSGLKVTRGDAQARKVEMYLTRSELLMVPGYTRDRSARRLLYTLPEQITLMPLVVEAMQGYALIEDEVLRILLEACVSAIPTLRDGIAKVAPQPGQHPAVLHFQDRDDGVDGLNISYQSFPALADLDGLQAAAGTPDPLASLRRAAPSKPARKPDMLNADRQAARLVSVWLEHDGDSPELQEIVGSPIASDGAAALVPGLVNLCPYLSAMVATLIGSAPQALIGSFAEEPDS